MLRAVLRDDPAAAVRCTGGKRDAVDLLHAVFGGSDRSSGGKSARSDEETEDDHTREHKEQQEAPGSSAIQTLAASNSNTAMLPVPSSGAMAAHASSRCALIQAVASALVASTEARGVRYRCSMRWSADLFACDCLPAQQSQSQEDAAPAPGPRSGSLDHVGRILSLPIVDAPQPTAAGPARSRHRHRLASADRAAIAAHSPAGAHTAIRHAAMRCTLLIGLNSDVVQSIPAGLVTVSLARGLL